MADPQRDVPKAWRDIPAWAGWAGLAIIMAGVALYCVPIFFSVFARDSRVIYTYFLDSFVILYHVQSALDARFFKLNFTDYPHLYFNLAIALAYLYSLFAHPTQETITFILRGLSLVGSLLTILASYLFARRFFGVSIALFCAAALAVCPALILLSYESHPDTWQALLVSLSLFLMVLSLPNQQAQGASGSQTVNLKWLFCAAAAAGAAFGTKYIGVLLLPFLVLPALTMPLREQSAAGFARLTRAVAIVAGLSIIPLLLVFFFVTMKRAPRLFPGWQALIPQASYRTLILAIRGGGLAGAAMATIFLGTYVSGFDLTKYRHIVLRILVLICIPLIFFLVFALSSPWAVWKLYFVSSVFVMGEYVNFGHGTRAAWYGYNWLFLLAGARVLGAGVAMLTAIGIVSVLADWKSKGFRVAQTPLLFVAGWTLFYLAFLMFRINLVKPYYALPMIPAAVVLAGAGLAAVRNLVASRLGRDMARGVVVVLAGGSLITQAFLMLPVLRADAMPTTISTEKLAMANWMLRCVPVHTRIMTAAYSYIPPAFDNAWMNTDQGGFERLENYRPGLVIVNAEDIAYYEGSLVDSSTNLLGNTNDKVLYFHTIARSGKWAAGPVFGTYRVYLQPGLHQRISSAKPGCFRS